MSIIKEARIVKRKGKYCVIGHKKDKNGKHRNMGCYSNRAEAEERLKQISMFKYKKAMVLNIMTNAVDRLENKGIIHIADVIENCAAEVAKDISGDHTAIKLMKIVNLLEKRGEFDIAEQIDSVIPEVLDKGE